MSDVDPNGVKQHDAGAKLDAGKVDMSLLTLWPRALYEVCRVGSLGASKYSRGGFLSVSNGFIRYTAAMLRHMFRETAAVYDDDPYYDTPGGAPYKGKIRHDAQVAWNALSRLEVKLREEEKTNEQRTTELPDSNDRPAPIKPRNTLIDGPGDCGPGYDVSSAARARYRDILDGPWGRDADGKLL